MNNIISIQTIIEWAIEELEERYQDDDFTQEISDSIYEIADSHVPIYYSELRKAASSDFSLIREEPECWPAFNGDNTPINLIAANIYERIVAELRNRYNQEHQ